MRLALLCEVGRFFFGVIYCLLGFLTADVGRLTRINADES